MPQPKPHSTLYSPQTLFGKFLFEELLCSQLYLGEFAEKIGVNARTLVRFFEKDDSPSLDVLLIISQRLNVNFLMLVLLARPESAQALVRQQTQRSPHDAEQRLIDSGLLPIDTLDMVKGVLDKDQEDQLVDALTIMDAAMTQMALGPKPEDKDRLVAIHERHIQRILNSLGMGEA